MGRNPAAALFALYLLATFGLVLTRRSKIIAYDGLLDTIDTCVRIEALKEALLFTPLRRKL
jgi:hypothetical protein